MDQGKVRGQGHGHIPEDHPREVPGVELNAMLQQFNAFADQERSNTRVPVMHPEEEPNVGQSWVPYLNPVFCPPKMFIYKRFWLLKIICKGSFSL